MTDLLGSIQLITITDKFETNGAPPPHCVLRHAGLLPSVAVTNRIVIITIGIVNVTYGTDIAMIYNGIPVFVPGRCCCDICVDAFGSNSMSPMVSIVDLATARIVYNGTI